MRSSTATTILILLASAPAILALPATGAIAPFPVIFGKPIPKAQAPKAATPAAAPSAAAAAAAPAPASASPASNAAQANNATAAPCSKEVAALAQGIIANIADQRNERAAVEALGALLAENPVDTTMFASARTSLLNFVTQGINIRENNQAIAPAGNAAIPGLAVVAQAQQAELNLTMGLSAADLKGANASVVTLKSDFEGGIKKNGENLDAATGGCTVNGQPVTVANLGNVQIVVG